MKEAIAAVVRNKKITEQTEVDAMAKAINEAISKLVLKDANYTKVNEAKAKVPSNLNIYTEETVNALQEALAAVEEGKNITEQETVDGYAKAINEAINSLVIKDADYTSVNQAIAQANNLVEGNYKDYTKVKEAVAAVVRNKKITEQTEVDAMAKAINEEISKLVLKDADYTLVDQAIDQANNLVEGNYKDYTKVKEAIDAVVRNKKITEQTEVYAMANAINEAISKLVLKEANYTKVNEAKAKVPSNLNIYTEETVNALQEALAAVKEGKKITEQTKVDGYAKAINEAINSLVIKDTISTKQEAVTPTVKVETTNKETVKAENKKEVKKVKTGDSTNSVLYLGLFGFSLLIIYCIVMKKIIR